jgi:predicted DCC family thiol-disulfide oxidoreductase YuxK
MATRTQIEVIHDGACPVCRRSVHRLKQRAGDPRIALIDARAALTYPLFRALRRMLLYLLRRGPIKKSP